MAGKVRPSECPSERPTVRPIVRLIARPPDRPSVRSPVRPTARPIARPCYIFYCLLCWFARSPDRPSGRPCDRSNTSNYKQAVGGGDYQLLPCYLISFFYKLGNGSAPWLLYGLGGLRCTRDVSKRAGSEAWVECRERGNRFVTKQN